jgi:thiol-disulfide isomerase/thioredoxin
VELSRSFECVYIEIGKHREIAKKLEVRSLLDVLFLTPDRQRLARYRPEGIREKGDAKALLVAMKQALSPPKAREIALPGEGRELIGTAAPAWCPDGWLVGKAMKLEDLRGKVVLIRFFTNTCPFCAASMPALQTLHERYAEKGLTTIGFYHPKPHGAKRTAESVKRLLASWKVTFPIALDTRWKTLDRWWLSGKRRRATSVSFLIDRKGKIRWLHPGPELHPGKEGCNVDPARCNRSYSELEKAIGVLLEER